MADYKSVLDSSINADFEKLVSDLVRRMLAEKDSETDFVDAFSNHFQSRLSSLVTNTLDEFAKFIALSNDEEVEVIDSDSVLYRKKGKIVEFKDRKVIVEFEDNKNKLLITAEFYANQLESCEV